MRLLIDNALSPLLSSVLDQAGHDALHVRDVGLFDADDETILRFADSERRVIVTADTDFGTLLALGRGQLPSVILFRKGSTRLPERQAAFLVANLPALEEDLRLGAIVTILEDRIRVRRLPLRPA